VHDPVASSATTALSSDGCQVVELRRYALHPGQRDTLIELFDDEFVETQEAAGMCILGQFRDLDDPDSFVWMRGFADMETRKEALESFYQGPAWKQHAQAANATMVDVSNVLLLRPITTIDLIPSRRRPPGTSEGRSGLIVVTIYPLVEHGADDFPALFLSAFEPVLRDADIQVLATYATEHSENTFPSLPVREEGDFFVWVTTFADERDHARHVAELERSPVWRNKIAYLLALRGRAEVLRLRPTARSLFPLGADGVANPIATG
jgi:quinol monooxygenase YgiN